ncbi:MAG: biotin-dependent carboxyltransferase family protein, partial [Balneolaceae bacterium]
MIGSLKVLDGGLFTTIQDTGRTGFRKYGIPASGVMDAHATKLANWLVGNPHETPVIEMTLQGASYQFQSDAVIGISGANMDARVNNQQIERYKTQEIREGDTLSFSYAKSGCRAYLAIQGEWKVEEVLGSYSAYTMGGFGGKFGRIIKKNDVLEWDFEKQERGKREVPRKLLPYYSSSGNRIRIIAGQEWEVLSKENQKRFLGREYQISSESNRMGMRLQGEPLYFEGGEMVSSAVIPGIVQLPKQGNPIILMQDGQTAGGYPRI